MAGCSQASLADQEPIEVSESNMIVAQLVMKDEDGSSILTKDAGRVETASTGDLKPERVEAIVERLEKRGFEVLSSNLNTLSIAAPDPLFVECFGVSASALKSGEASLDSAKMEDQFEPLVADIFVPPAPQTFP
jgi:hypothetical protein